MSTPEQTAHAARWAAAGLDPDIQSATLAGYFLDYVTPAGAWALAVCVYSRAWWYASDEVHVLVLVACAVGEG